MPDSSVRLPLKGKSSGIRLLIACAFCAVAITGTGGVLVYSNTQHLIESRKWLEHTHAVLTSLQTQTQRLDRVASGISLLLRGAHA